MTRKRIHIPFVAFAVVMFVFAVVWALWPASAAYGRETIVIAADPVTIVSYNPRDTSLVTLAFPADIALEGTDGVGTYSLSALWRLGDIDKKDRPIFSQSIGQTLGIPITGYVGPKTGELPETDPATAAKNTFSFGRLMGFIWGSRTDIDIRTYVRFILALHIQHVERVKLFDFRDNSLAIANDITLPDGSHQLVADPDKIDAELKGVFEDEQVRRESVTVAVYNTTPTASLGTRVARILVHTGISVVTVGNDSPVVAHCTLTGKKEALASLSAKIIHSLFGCTPIESSDPLRADLLLRMGSANR